MYNTIKLQILFRNFPLMSFCVPRIQSRMPHIAFNHPLFWQFCVLSLSLMTLTLVQNTKKVFYILFFSFFCSGKIRSSFSHPSVRWLCTFIEHTHLNILYLILGCHNILGDFLKICIQENCSFDVQFYGFW